MFDRIAPVYDAMNHVMSAGLDRRWRAATAAEVVRPGDRVLDSCCGTGDLALADLRAGGRVTGVDFSAAMLDQALQSLSGVWTALAASGLVSCARDLLSHIGKRPAGDGRTD